MELVYLLLGREHLAVVFNRWVSFLYVPSGGREQCHLLGCPEGGLPEASKVVTMRCLYRERQRHYQAPLGELPLQLARPLRARLDDGLLLSVGPLEGIELLLQLDDGLIPLVQPRSERYHDVPLLEQQRLVPVYLRLVLFHLLPLDLQLVDAPLILLSESPLLLF